MPLSEPLSGTGSLARSADLTTFDPTVAASQDGETFSPRAVTPEQRARIEAAKAAIGEGTGDDYRLALADHPDQIARVAPELAARLRRSDARAIAARYGELDRDAGVAQARFKALSERARKAAFWAGVSSALLVVAGSLTSWVEGLLPPPAAGQPRGDAVSDTIVIVLSVLAVGASAFAAAVIHVVRTGRLLETWMGRRAEAESTRLAYFALVTRPEQYGEPLLALEYFRRYLLDSQCAYFRERGGEHQRGGDRRLLNTAVAIGAGAAASALAGLLGTAVGAQWAALGVGTLLAQAYLTREEIAEETEQDRRKADRYARVYGALVQVTGRLDDVREATAAGELAIVRPFVSAVHEPLAAEIAQWQTETGTAGTAVGRLEELLAEYESKRGGKPAAKPAEQ